MNVIRRSSQVALICNVVFLFCVLLRYVTLIRDPVLISITLILGWIMSFWINAAVNLGIAVVLGRRLWTRTPGPLRPVELPLWLLLANLGIGLVQVYYYFLQ